MGFWWVKLEMLATELFGMHVGLFGGVGQCSELGLGDLFSFWGLSKEIGHIDHIIIHVGF